MFRNRGKQAVHYCYLHHQNHVSDALNDQKPSLLLTYTNHGQEAQLNFLTEYIMKKNPIDDLKISKDSYHDMI